VRAWLRKNSNDRYVPKEIGKAQTQKMAMQGKSRMGLDLYHLVMTAQKFVNLIPRPSIA
jgi:hypothetical protein